MVQIVQIMIKIISISVIHYFCEPVSQSAWLMSWVRPTCIPFDSRKAEKDPTFFFSMTIPLNIILSTLSNCQISLRNFEIKFYGNGRISPKNKLAYFNKVFGQFLFIANTFTRQWPYRFARVRNVGR